MCLGEAAMSIDWEKSWKDLGVLVTIYAMGVFGYSVFVYFKYGRPIDPYVQDLITSVPSFLEKDKSPETLLHLMKISLTVIYYTLPLTITVALLSFYFTADSLSVFGVFLCIVAPFATFHILFNWAVFRQFLQQPFGWTSTPLYILNYYIHDYGIQALGSVLFGGYAGYKLAK